MIASGVRVWVCTNGNGEYPPKTVEMLATQAVGRALGYFGFVAEGTEMATSDEMIALEHTVATRKDPRQTTKRSEATPTEPTTVPSQNGKDNILAQVEVL